MHDNSALAELLRELTMIANDGNLAAVVVHLNDTSYIESRKRSEMPSMGQIACLVARIRECVKRLIGDDRTLVLHSGDWLSPSLPSKFFRGSQMVRSLNAIGLTCSAVGNHEFDFGPDNLQRRLTKARFRTVLANLTPNTDLQEKFAKRFHNVIYWPEADPYLAITGLIGKAAASDATRSGFTWVPPREALSQVMERAWKQPNVGMLLVLSHAERDEDRELMQFIDTTWGRRGLCCILGGHDHDIQWKETDFRYCVLCKNLANLRSVRVIAIRFDSLAIMRMSMRALYSWAIHNDVSEVISDLATLMHEVTRSEIREAACRLVASIIADWKTPFEGSGSVLKSALDQAAKECEANLKGRDSHRFLASSLLELAEKRILSSRVLDCIAKRTSEERDNDVLINLEKHTNSLDATDAHLRSRSTDFGNFVADCIQHGTKSELAFITAGSFRIDSILPSRLTQRDLREVFLYDAPDAVVVVVLTPQECKNLLQYAATGHGEGRFLQISGGTGEVIGRAAGLVRVALIAYMIKGELDGYGVGLAKTREANVEELRNILFGQSKQKSWSIVELIRKNASSVSYCPDQRVACLKSDDPYSEIIVEFQDLSDKFVEACRNENIEPRYKLLEARGLRRYEIEKQQTLPETVMRNREELREFVACVKTELGFDAFEKIYYQMQESRRTFEKGIPYDLFFDHAAY